MRKKCIDKVDKIPNIYYRLKQDTTTRVTRSISKILDRWKHFTIIEVYRCMPLLGDEDNIPHWDVHIVKYAVVFI